MHFGLKRTQCALLGGTAILALSASFAQAQTSTDQGAQSAAPEQIVVTGTRIQRQGFTAPTPVTTMTAQDLQIAGYTNVGDALADLPMADPDWSPKTDNSYVPQTGFNLADLRGLGFQRTLTLIDGERPVWDANLGFDMNSIPIDIVQRVDVVTGGASAAYGSDAVAGVINLVLNDHFTGFKGNFQYGQDWQGYGQNYLGSVAFGDHFGPNDRGHFMVAGQFTSNAMITTTRVPQLEDALIGNPNAGQPGQPDDLLIGNTHFSGASLGGLITGCNNAGGSVACPTGLAGVAFGAGGTPYNFQYGQYASSGYMSGGDPEASPEYNKIALGSNQHENIFAETDYEVFSNLTVKADFSYSNYATVDPIFPTATWLFGVPFQINNTNAYLPTSIKNTMAANGITSIDIGRDNSDFGGLLGQLTAKNNEQKLWGSLRADGTFGDNWSFNLFYTYGEMDMQSSLGPQQNDALLQESINSVIGPGGQPVCASTALKNPTTGASCVPVNLFGFGSPSTAAIDFFSGYSMQYITVEQNEASGQIQGEPFSTWAGPVSVVGGMEWRTESEKETDDAASAAGDYNVLPYQPEFGHYSVTEGFVETVVPLLHDLPAAEEFDFNGAVRESGYSTSGDIMSWKLGATDKATDDLTLRATFSQDIRAPNLSELYTSQSILYEQVVNPASGLAEQAVIYGGGNPKLLPETAHTNTYGFVYTPSWLPNFNFSADWWTIDLHNVIGAYSAQTLLDNCYAGVTADCGQISYSGGVATIYSYNLNINKLETSGLDLEATHHLDLGDVVDGVPGSLDSHWQMTYVDKYALLSQGVYQAEVGVLSDEAAVRYRTVLTETYNWDQISAYLRFRYISGGEITNVATVNENHIDGQYYFDAGASYFLSDDKKYQVYFNVVDLADRPPPAYAANWYDWFGRTFTAGVRVAL